MLFFSTKSLAKHSLSRTFGGLCIFPLVLVIAGCGGDGGGTGPDPIPQVASVSVTGPANVEAGKTITLSATATSTEGSPMAGQSFTWGSSNEAVATVSNGVVSGVAPGTARITATAGGKQGEATVTVTAAAASRVAINPLYATTDVGQAINLAAQALNSQGQPAQGASVAWSSLNTNIATVDPATGRTTGVAAGQARIVAQSGTAADTATVAVLGTRTILSTAFPREASSTTGAGVIRANVTPGQTITVPVMLDLRKASANGDLGAVQFELTYDPAVLEYQSVTAGVSGSVDTHLVQPGKFRYAFVNTNPQQQNAPLPLATVTFRVPNNAAVGTQRAVNVTYSTRPTDTNLNAYEQPITVGGTVRVVSP